MSDNNITEISKELMDLKLQSVAQMNIITNLNKKNKDLQEEIVHLKKLLESTTPIIKSSTDLIPVSGDNEELSIDICRLEIAKLHKKSLTEDLTYENCKALEVYTKIINATKNQPKTIELKAKKLSDVDLLAVLEPSKNV